MINSGRLRHRIRIEQLVNLTDSNGDVIQDENSGEVAQEWQLFQAVWAAIEPLSAKEFIASQATQSKVVARITIRHLVGVNAGMRAIHNGKTYNIEGALADKDSGLEYLTLPVSEGVSASGQ